MESRTDSASDTSITAKVDAKPIEENVKKRATSKARAFVFLISFMFVGLILAIVIFGVTIAGCGRK